MCICKWLILLNILQDKPGPGRTRIKQNHHIITKYIMMSKESAVIKWHEAVPE